MTDANEEKWSPFQYEPLPDKTHIRLLERQGKTEDGILSFGLISRTIEGFGPEYHCLSYTWGNPFAHGNQFREHYVSVDSEYGQDNKLPILVNGQVLYIQKNLHDALTLLPQKAYVDYINRRMDGKDGQAYLHVSASRGRAPHVEIWLRCGAEKNQLDDNGQTALHHAAQEGQLDCVKVLLRYGVRKDIKDNHGATAVDLANAKGHTEVVQMLESDEPDPIEKLPPLRPDNLVWADAICVNQNDVDEKSAQVSIMDRIYSVATYVTAWLGPHDEHSQTGITTLNTLHDHLKQFQESPIESFGGYDKDNYTTAGVPFISWPEWISLASVYQRQWFRRAWIVQEAVLPTVLLMYIGDSTLSWSHLGEVSEALRRNEAKLGTGGSTAFVPPEDAAVPVEWNMAEVFKWRTNKSNANRTDIDNAEAFRNLFTLREMVYNFWTFLASDPRDKVFAFYGVLNLFAMKRQNADYHLSLATVYTAAARRLIQEEGSLKTLLSCVYPLQRRSDLPTWVPDFSLPGINGVSGNFSADNGFEYQPFDDAPLDCPILHVKGAKVGTVTRTSGRQGTGPSEKLLFDPSWLTLVLSLRGNGGYGPQPILSEVLWRTLCMDMSYGSLFDPGSYGNRAPDEFGMQFRMFFTLLMLAGGDRKIRDRMSLPLTTKTEIIFSHLDYDPMKKQEAGGGSHDGLQSSLEDLDALETHDGGKAWTPGSDEVLQYWNDLRCSLVRNTSVDENGGPNDFYVPPEVQEGKSRVVGNGFLNLNSRMARRFYAFTRAYTVVYGGRQLITVDDKFLGMAALSVVPDDEIWIIPGLNAPAVLRRAKGSVDVHGTPRYEFIGACYIHGLMHGEVARGGHAPMMDIALM